MSAMMMSVISWIPLRQISSDEGGSGDRYEGKQKR